MDHVPLLRLRLLSVGTVGSVAAWRTAGVASVLGEPVAGRVLRVVAAGAGDGAESDALSVPATARCRSECGECGERGGAGFAAGDLRRGGAGAAEFAGVV